MQRRTFIQQAALTGAAITLSKLAKAGAGRDDFPVVRIAEAQRKFKSPAVEKIITDIQSNTGNREIAWLFGNCFPNTLDTTVDFEMIDGKPDTYVITGDIDAMWLRDSSAQVWPYVPLCKQDDNLQQLIKGVINRQVKCILKDPYANAFYKDENKVSEWKKTDITDMKPGIHERKWEVDSLCYPIRLSYGYWKETGDTSVFDDQWIAAMQLVVKTFKEQQRFDSPGPYTFQRQTSWATDGVPLSGYGYPVKPNGLICSMFRPSDDATIFPYLIPANWFAVVSLKQMTAIATSINQAALAADAEKLRMQVQTALEQHAAVQHPAYNKIYAYEINGFGSYNLMDDANVPSLLSLPYLLNTPFDRSSFFYSYAEKSIYPNTRQYILSTDNPFFFKGKAAEGTGGPHAGLDMIWPLSIIMRGITSHNEAEIKRCLTMLQHTHAGTGFMHESFHKDDPTKFTRKWFAWANTLFGEFVWKVYRERPQLLN
ncbi:MAG TPA: glycoside hydrolase family 125 protein [Chitinophagaceae bacterium]|nr:glycoside hydrolase family 125 protein [Chitinophagaceae bacterium]